MITLTNKYGISDAIVKACMIDNHITIGDISVTQLIDAPQVRILRKQNDVEEDVTDRIWMMMGTAVHYVVELGEVNNREARQILEAAQVFLSNGNEKVGKWMCDFVNKEYPNHKNKDILNEVTLSHTIDGMTFSGTFDRYTVSKGLLDDYKNTSVYAYMNEESRKKWDAQLNVYAFLLRENGYEVNEAQITAIFRDFSAGKSFTKGYPKKPIETFPVKLYSHKQMAEYLRERIRIHKNAEETGILPECTTKEMWATSDVFAVMSPGRKRAIALFPSEKLSKAFLIGDGQKYDKAYIEKRPGERKRCDSYCSVSHVCKQNIARNK